MRAKGEIKFKNKLYYVGQAFGGLEVALRPTDRDGYFDLFFGWKKIGALDLNDPSLAQQRPPPLVLPSPSRLTTPLDQKPHLKHSSNC